MPERLFNLETVWISSHFIKSMLGFFCFSSKDELPVRTLYQNQLYAEVCLRYLALYPELNIIYEIYYMIQLINHYSALFFTSRPKQTGQD